MLLCVLPSALFFCLGFSAVCLALPSNKTTAQPTSVSPVSVVTPTILPPPYGHFNVSDSSGKVCLLLDLKCEVHVGYRLIDNTTKSVEYTVPANANISGKCVGDGHVSSLNLTWPCSADSQVTLVLSMEFLKSSERWSASSVSFQATTSRNGSLVTNGTESTLFAVVEGKNHLPIKAKLTHSYECGTNKTIQLGSKVSVNILKIRVQPFSGEFGKDDVCSASSGGRDADPVNDSIVPIIVGCALLGMVIILIITYFVGRIRRSGYEKM